MDGFDASDMSFNSTRDLSNIPPNPDPSTAATVDLALSTGLTVGQISSIGANLPRFNQLGPAPILAQGRTQL